MGRFRAKAAEARADRARGDAGDAIVDALRESKAEFEAKAADLLERIKDSEAVTKAQARSVDLAAAARDKVREAELAGRAGAGGAKAAAIAKAAEAAAAAERARDATRRSSEERLERVGEWLAASKAGEAMGVSAPRGRRFPAWLLALLAVGVGYAVAKLTSRREEPVYSDDFVAAAERLTPAQEPLSPASSDASAAGTAGDAAPAGRPLAERVRSSLEADDRTRSLTGLAINVAEGTVFVRGTVPAGFEEVAIREVVASVPGVTDVDLQVTATA